MISFTVIGTPQPQGSTRAFYVKKLGRAVITSTNKNLKPWRQEVSGMAAVAMNEAKEVIMSKPAAIRLEADFYFDKPKSSKRDAAKTTKPDVDKLARSVGDSLTGIVFDDDSQITELLVRKHFGQPARVEIRVWAK